MLAKYSFSMVWRASLLHVKGLVRQSRPNTPCSLPLVSFSRMSSKSWRRRMATGIAHTWYTERSIDREGGACSLGWWPQVRVVVMSMLPLSGSTHGGSAHASHRLHEGAWDLILPVLWSQCALIEEDCNLHINGVHILAWIDHGETAGFH
jgi:hypothetical protein